MCLCITLPSRCEARTAKSSVSSASPAATKVAAVLNPAAKSRSYQPHPEEHRQHHRSRPRMRPLQAHPLSQDPPIPRGHALRTHAAHPHRVRSRSPDPNQRQGHLIRLTPDAACGTASGSCRCVCGSVGLRRFGRRMRGRCRFGIFYPMLVNVVPCIGNLLSAPSKS